MTRNRQTAAGLAVAACIAVASSTARAQVGDAQVQAGEHFASRVHPLRPAWPELLSPRLFAPAPAPAPAMSRSTGTATMVAGLALTLVGGAMVGVGAGMALSHGEEFDNDGLEPNQKAGIGLLIGGGVALAVGIPLIVVGKRARPDGTTAAASALSFRF